MAELGRSRMVAVGEYQGKCQTGCLSGIQASQNPPTEMRPSPTLPWPPHLVEGRGDSNATLYLHNTCKFIKSFVLSLPPNKPMSKLQLIKVKRLVWGDSAVAEQTDCSFCLSTVLFPPDQSHLN